MTTQYQISNLTTYDSDDLLYYTKIGKTNKEMSLFCIVAGKTYSESRQNALSLLNMLNNPVKEPTQI